MDLGKKVVKPPPAPPPEWKTHTNPAFEINSKGQLRTKNHQPPLDPTTYYPWGYHP